MLGMTREERAAAETLGFTSGEAVDTASLKQKYGRAAKQYHPDHFTGAEAAVATENMQKINAARSVLKDYISSQSGETVAQAKTTSTASSASAGTGTPGLAVYDPVFAASQAEAQKRSSSHAHRENRSSGFGSESYGSGFGSAFSSGFGSHHGFDWSGRRGFSSSGSDYFRQYASEGESAFTMKKKISEREFNRQASNEYGTFVIVGEDSRGKPSVMVIQNTRTHFSAFEYSAGAQGITNVQGFVYNKLTSEIQQVSGALLAQEKPRPQQHSELELQAA